MQTAEYACGRCGLEMTTTDHRNNVRRMLGTAVSHNCKPRSQAKTL